MSGGYIEGADSTLNHVRAFRFLSPNAGERNTPVDIGRSIVYFCAHSLVSRRNAAEAY